MAWRAAECDDYLKTKKEFIKKWPAEMRAVATNLATLLNALNSGSKAEQLKNLGFVRSEPSGILAISERGVAKGTKPKALRLYIFADELEEIVYLMLFGEKQRQQQSRDIGLCETFVKKLLESRQD